MNTLMKNNLIKQHLCRARLLTAVWIAVVFPWLGSTGFSQQSEWTENFTSLDQWEPLTFESISRHSEYQIKTADGTTFLHMQSENAGSGIVLKEAFDPREFPIVEWKWRVDDPITGVDHTRKSGDDYPVRVYLFWEYDGTGLGFADRMRYRAYRALRGEYPPHSGLAFTWTHNPVETRLYPNPYSDRVGMRVMRGPETSLGSWQTERINILE